MGGKGSSVASALLVLSFACSEGATANGSAAGGAGSVDAGGAPRDDGAAGAGGSGQGADGGIRAALPLSTCGRWIVDRNGKRVKLAGVNWYGASDVKHVVGGLDVLPMNKIVATIVDLGFNSIRLPFSN